MEFARMLDEDQQPSEEEILAAVGAGNLWSDLKKYIDQSYDFVPEKVFYGKKYPEHGAFTALVVLGKKEGEKVAEILDELSTATRDLIGSAKQLHDGKWLWIRVLEPSHVEDVKLLPIHRRLAAAESKQNRVRPPRSTRPRRSLLKEKCP